MRVHLRVCCCMGTQMKGQWTQCANIRHSAFVRVCVSVQGVSCWRQSARMRARERRCGGFELVSAYSVLFVCRCDMLVAHDVRHMSRRTRVCVCVPANVRGLFHCFLWWWVCMVVLISRTARYTSNTQWNYAWKKPGWIVNTHTHTRHTNWYLEPILLKNHNGSDSQ